MSMRRHPRLHLPVGEETTITVVSDPKSGEGSWGQWWYYLVRKEGSDELYSFFPSPALAELLRVIGVQKGDTITIVRQLDESNERPQTYYVVTKGGETYTTLQRETVTTTEEAVAPQAPAEETVTPQPATVSSVAEAGMLGDLRSVWFECIKVAREAGFTDDMAVLRAAEILLDAWMRIHGKGGEEGK